MSVYSIAFCLTQHNLGGRGAGHTFWYVLFMKQNTWWGGQEGGKELRGLRFCATVLHVLPKNTHHLGRCQGPAHIQHSFSLAHMLPSCTRDLKCNCEIKKKKGGGSRGGPQALPQTLFLLNIQWSATSITPKNEPEFGWRSSPSWACLHSHLRLNVPFAFIQLCFLAQLLLLPGLFHTQK